MNPYQMPDYNTALRIQHEQREAEQMADFERLRGSAETRLYAELFEELHRRRDRSILADLFADDVSSAFGDYWSAFLCDVARRDTKRAADHLAYAFRRLAHEYIESEAGQRRVREIVGRTREEETA